jgi:hypothetical protein
MPPNGGIFLSPVLLLKSVFYCIIEIQYMKYIKALILLAILAFQTFTPLALIHASTTVMSMTPSITAITDQDGGKPFSITVRFSGPMDTANDPTIVLTSGGADLNASGTLSFVGTNWSDATTYTINYSIVDQDEQYPSVDAYLLGANSAAAPGPLPPEPPIDYDTANLFSVDTVTPVSVTPPVTIVSAVPSAPVINDSMIGQPFDFVVTYSAPMDASGGNDPSIILTPDLFNGGVAPATLTFNSASWSPDGTVYTVSSTINDHNETIPSVDANIVGGAGANSVPPSLLGMSSFNNFFSIDTESPAVTAITTTGATGNNGVYKIGDTVRVSWDNTALGDNNADVSTATADFSAFGGPASAPMTKVGNVWTASYTIVEGTLNTVLHVNPSVTVTDIAGNAVTVMDDADATIDNTINGFGVLINQPFINTTNQNALAFTFSNAEVGATYDYDINGAITGSGMISAPNDMITGIAVSSLPDGVVTLSVHLTDAAGNVSATVHAPQRAKDTTLPTAVSTVSNPTINLSSVGAQMSVTAKFSEPMNTSFMPSVAFSPNIVTSGTLTLSSMGWLDNKTYRVIYDTHTVPEAEPSINLLIGGGKDQYGNQMSASTTTGALSVDTMPPVAVVPPTPTPPTSPAHHTSGGGGSVGGIVTPQAPSIFVPTVLATETPFIAPVPARTDDAAPTQIEGLDSALASTAEVSPLAAPVIEQKPSAPSSTQLASAASAGIDLFSGSKIYVWLLILVCLIILGRVGVSLARKEK